MIFAHGFYNVPIVVAFLVVIKVALSAGQASGLMKRNHGHRELGHVKLLALLMHAAGSCQSCKENSAEEWLHINMLGNFTSC